jgi:gas vesicle protein
MGKAGKTIATLLVGAVVGAAVGYLLTTDKDKRKEDMDKLKDRLNGLKDKLGKKAEDLERDIYHS